MYLVCRLLLATHRTSLYTLSLHDALPILSKRKIPQIDPVDFDLPGLGIVKATEQLEKRGLAGAIGAHDSHGTARGNRHTEVPQSHPIGAGDRKSTRLNSSHRCISYAVFCLLLIAHRSTLFPYTTLFRS